MQRLIIVRHGECDGNKDGIFRGRFDFPLNQTGLQQAREVAADLMRYSFSKVYSSPLKRSLQTAQAIADAKGVSVVAMEEFNNINLGHWEGQSKDKIKKRYPKEWEIWRAKPECLTLSNAETLEMVQKRALAGVEQLKSLSDETVILVTHRSVFKVLLAGILDMGGTYFWKLHIDNAAYSELLLNDDNFMLSKHNHTNHLSHFIYELY